MCTIYISDAQSSWAKKNCSPVWIVGIASNCLLKTNTKKICFLPLPTKFINFSPHPMPTTVFCWLISSIFRLLAHYFIVILWLERDILFIFNSSPPRALIYIPFSDSDILWNLDYIVSGTRRTCAKFKWTNGTWAECVCGIFFASFPFRWASARNSLIQPACM